MLLESVLIANRGEIACRVMRTAKRLGMRTIAVYSEADAQALHVRLADEAHCIGPPPAHASYLAIDKIVAAAKAAGAQCVHPGYGFLAENADFAEACAAAGIVFVGPPPAAIRAMGLKDKAKALMQKAGVPTVPGYHGGRQDAAFLKRKAEEIGYPVLVKAVAGGGGKGMRRIDGASDFEAALGAAQREAAAAFGNPRILLERHLASPRHIEFQVFADDFGNVIQLGERDCSLQRRHQKVMEEAPAPGMTPALRERVGQAAVAAARAVGYRGAGTVEFIVDASRGLTPNGFYFMEMNTRLQVEHPVTEMVTGLDLVEMQFRVAAGEELALKQDAVKLEGHAVEARLYAEDPDRGFVPSNGKLWRLSFPKLEGVRIETGVEEGDVVTSFYDPMLAKVIAHRPTRAQALDALAAVLRRTLVAGPKCNLAFLQALATASDFRADHFDTGLIERNLDALTSGPRPYDSEAACLGFIRAWQAGIQPGGPEGGQRPAQVRSPWAALDGFQLGERRRQSVPILVEDEATEARVTWPRLTPRIAGEAATVEIGGTSMALCDPFPTPEGVEIVATADAVLVLRNGRQTSVRLLDPLDRDEALQLDDDGSVKAPMHGKVVALLVKPGDAIAKGQRVVLLEAMKMEHALVAPQAGVVAEILAEEGEQVAQGAKILVVAGPASG